jgi:two-component system, cell cycle response regulator
MSRQTNPLPTLPAVALKLLSVLADDHWSIQALSDTIRIDPSLTSKMIREANLAHRSADRPIADIDRAVMLLGKKKVASLALTFSLSPVIARDKRLAKYYQEYWTESAVQAVTAELLASKYQLEDENRYFTAGLLQDLGRLYLLQTYGEEYTRLVEIGKLGKRSLVDLEREAFGETHPALGGAMLSTWKFPPRMSAAIAIHHQFHELTIKSPPALSLELVLRIASLMGEFFCGHHRGLVLLLLEEALSHCPEPRIATEELADQVCKRLAEVADAFRLDVSAIPQSNAILTESLQQIASMALSHEYSDTPNHECPASLSSDQILQDRLQELVRHFQIDLPTVNLKSHDAPQTVDSQTSHRAAPIVESTESRPSSG